MKIKLGTTYLDRNNTPHTIKKLLDLSSGIYIFSDGEWNFWDENGKAEPSNVMDNRPERPLDLVKEVVT